MLSYRVQHCFFMNHDRFWELVSLRLSGESTPEELAELAALLKDHPSESQRVETLIAIWGAKQQGTAAVGRNETFNRHLQRLSNHLSKPVLQYEEEGDVVLPEEKPLVQLRSRRWGWVAGVAACLLVGVFIFSNRTERLSANKEAQNTITTKRGSKSKVQLPDGSEVWLNADSKITYKENFQGQNREVQLEGEAFFDVARDDSRPFIIHTPAIDVRVLGTAFNVRAYADERNTETSLIRGSVEITLVKSPDLKKIILKPNDKLIVNNELATVADRKDANTVAPLLTLAKIKYTAKDTLAQETMWTSDKLVFDAEPIEDVALKLERWYDVKVTIADEALRKTPFTGTFEGESLETVLEAMRLTGIKSIVNRREVTLRQ